MQKISEINCARINGGLYDAMVTKVKLKGALLGLRQFLTTEIPLKMMKNILFISS